MVIHDKSILVSFVKIIAPCIEPLNSLVVLEVIKSYMLMLQWSGEVSSESSFHYESWNTNEN